MRFFSILAFLCASISASFLEEPIMMELDEPALSPADPQESMELLRHLNFSNLVYGGRQARPGQFPQQAFLLLGKNSNCGASLISKTHAVTAAHCIDELKNGSKAKIMFSPAVTLNRNTKLAKIATDDSKLLRIRKSYVTGYGTVTETPLPRISSVLLWSEITLFSPSECRQKWRNRAVINDKQICAGANKKGTGKGDSGGPIQVLFNKKLWQVGLTSFGPANPYDSEHNQDRFPTVFTRVSSYCDFLRNSTNGAFSCTNTG
ncbi:hypothetical protein QR680_013573 [Steinernema hermaphroditum]|uniref:Peptidase S1 domain-containing protein n=1 Tax=Steinernema hermaphroditum TaxID=289476 RepID=A0AA39I8A7_9BILA|nr:hypothetical protein QR680_013573 [Steinernema hermaphroditum]